ncbi:hypothetical protein, partial [Gluconacetobacter entanii]
PSPINAEEMESHRTAQSQGVFRTLQMAIARGHVMPPCGNTKLHAFKAHALPQWQLVAAAKEAHAPSIKGSSTK